MNNHSKAARGAFTLVEILVVIGIIALLSAILFPVFARVREGGRKTVCNSNLRQMGLAFQQYTQDYNGRYPAPSTFYPFAGLVDWSQPGNWVNGEAGAAGSLADPTGDYRWTGKTANVQTGAIFSYVKTPSFYYCPSNADGGKKGLSYSMNCAMGAVSNSRIRQPVDLVLLVDEEFANDGYFYASDNPANGNTTPSPKSGANFPTASTDKLTIKHNGGGNLLFVDGHVKFFPFEKFPLDDSAEGLTNKWRATGTPRFHDVALGPFGSGMSPGQPRDYCNADKRVP